MKRSFLTVLAAVALVTACGQRKEEQVQPVETTTPAPAPAPAPPPMTPETTMMTTTDTTGMRHMTTTGM